MKGRLEHIDIIKGIAIFWVVLGHQASLFQLERISSWVNSFHLPLFMFSGGYIALKTAKPDLVKIDFLRIYIWKKFKTLIIPYTVWSLFLYSFLKGNFNVNILEGLTIYFINPPGTVLWFLHTYFFMLVVFTLFYISAARINKYDKPILDIIILLFLLLATGVLVKYVSLIPKNTIVFYPYFFLGVLLAKYDKIAKIITADIVYTLLFVTFIISSLMYNNLEIYWLNKFIKLVAGTSASLFFYQFTQAYDFNNTFRKNLVLIGKNSLVIYIVHFTLLMHKQNDIINTVTNSHFITYLLLLVFVVSTIIYVCISVGKLIEQFPYLNFIFFGKSSNVKKRIQ